MSMKVKRGLGLLVVALIAWVVGFISTQSTAIVPTLIAAGAGLMLIACLVVGLVLVAWGLLND